MEVIPLQTMGITITHKPLKNLTPIQKVFLFYAYNEQFNNDDSFANNSKHEQLKTLAKDANNE